MSQNGQNKPLVFKVKILCPLGSEGRDYARGFAVKIDAQHRTTSFCEIICCPVFRTL